MYCVNNLLTLAYKQVQTGIQIFQKPLNDRHQAMDNLDQIINFYERQEIYHEQLKCSKPIKFYLANKRSIRPASHQDTNHGPYPNE